MDGTLTVTLRGVRGSTPSPGPETARYGGNTTCLDVTFSPTHRLIIDCGTGLRQLHKDLPTDPGAEGYLFDVFFTHYHSDHVEGLRFFRPLYDRRSQFNFHGMRCSGSEIREALAGVMRPPWFPLELKDTASVKRYIEIDGSERDVAGVRIRAAMVHHPNGAAGYRLERNGHSLAFVPDAERGDPSAHSEVVELARNVDVLIHDAQYTPAEYDERYKSWGHSSFRHAIRLARDAGARRLVLFHHDPDRTDEQLDAIGTEARSEFAELDVAYEGMTFEL